MDNQQTQMYTSMLDQQISQNLANRGVGLADMLIRQLSANNAASNAANSAASGGKGGSSAGSATSHTLSANSLLGKSSALWQPDAATSDAASGNSSRQSAQVQAFQNRLAADAEEASLTTGIPAKFMLGQAALESGWGKRVVLAADGSSSHNLFGIKANASWKGKTVDAVTTEYINGVAQKRVEKFRAYDSYADSFRDYAHMLRSNPRYQNVLASAGDVKSFAQGLQRAGYATDPNYAAKLTNIINRNLSA
jgi:flagellar protein FlgJ